MLPSLELKPATGRKLLLDLVTFDPLLLNFRQQRSGGSCGLFCTCACAMSGLVPAAN